MTAPETPALDKLSSRAVEQAVLQEFLEWLSRQRYEIAQWDQVHGNDLLFPLSQPADDLIYEYLGIDKATLDAERRALLAHQRELTKAAGEVVSETNERAPKGLI